MPLAKFEDFENNIREADKQEKMADFKGASRSLFGQCKERKEVTISVESTEEKGVFICRKGDDGIPVKVRIIGFVE